MSHPCIIKQHPFTATHITGNQKHRRSTPKPITTCLYLKSELQCDRLRPMQQPSSRAYASILTVSQTETKIPKIPPSANTALCFERSS